jgi:WD40 repeat protein
MPTTSSPTDAIRAKRGLGDLIRTTAFVFGYDYFVSYAHRNGSAYASAIADALSGLDCSCFIDHSELPPGEALTPSLKRALRRSKAMVLIATEEAARSSYVRLEVDTFLTFSRRIIPVVINEADTAAWPQLASIVFLVEDSDSYARGEPSAKVLNGLRTAFRFNRRAIVLRRAAALLAVTFLALSLGLAVQGWRAQVGARRTRDAVLIAGAAQTSDPSVAALLLKELDRAREAREAATLAYRLITQGVPESVLRGHTAPVRRVAVDRTSQRIASVSQRETLLWSMDGTGAPRELSAGDVADLAFSPVDDAIVLALSHHGFQKDAIVVMQPDVPTASARTLEVKGTIDGVSFAANGTRLLVKGTTLDERSFVKGWVRVLEFPGLDEVVLLDDHLGEVTCMGASRDGSVVATGSLLGPAFIWREGGGGVVRIDEGSCADVSLDGKQVAVGMANGDIQIRDPSEIERINVVGSDRDGILALAFSQDGRWLASGSSSRTARVWQLDAADKITNMRRYVEHGDWVTAISLDPTGEWGLSRAGATARLFARDEERVERQLNGPPVNDARFSPNGSHVVTACADGTVRTWPVRINGIHSQSAADGEMASYLDVSSDGKRVLSASTKVAKTWDVANLHEPLAVLDQGEPFRGAAFALKGHGFVTGGAEGTVRLWPADDPRPQVIGRCRSQLRSLSLDASQSVVLAVCDEDVAVWSLRNGGELERIEAPKDVTGGQLSPSGRFAAISGLDGIFTLDLTRSHEPNGWTTLPVSFALATAFGPRSDRLAIASGRQVHLLTPEGKEWGQPLEHPNDVTHVAFSPDEGLLAAGMADGSLRIWTLEGSSPAVLFSGHREDVSGLSFSSDGTRLVTGSMDWTVRVWPADGLGDSLVLESNAPISAAKFVPDGAAVVAVGWNGALSKWNVGWSFLARALDGSINACLTPNDRVRLLGENVEEASARFIECEKAHGRPGIVPTQVTGRQ